MQSRNEWMVNRSNIVIALWDGSEKGGTYNCLKYAKSKIVLDKSDLQIVNYWDTFKQLQNKYNGECSLVGKATGS